MSEVFEKFMKEFTRNRSPYETMRLFRDIFNHGNTTQIEAKYQVSRYDIAFIRQFAGDCTLYVLDIQENLGVYYQKNSSETISKVA